MPRGILGEIRRRISGGVLDINSYLGLAWYLGENQIVFQWEILVRISEGIPAGKLHKIY